MAALKMIVTSKGNLKSKYGTAFKSVEKLLADLVRADKKRELKTIIIYIDDQLSCKRMGITSVASITPKTCKQAVDAIFKKHQPAYIMIFGAQDIFPFQDLANALYDPHDPEGDDDKLVFSDLPYACEAPYSNKMADFNDPTRVVGRMPDMPSQADVQYIKTLIKDSIRHKPKNRSEYEKYFAVSAHVWMSSSRTTIRNIFNNDDDLLDCPPDKTGYAKKKLTPLSHFFNCHGGEGYNQFYGQARSNGAAEPPSLDAVTDLDGKITYGTVIAAECCYGAQLLDPAESGPSIASNYLLNHAIAFMGSSTIAYGMNIGQSSADFICQFFFQSILSGASAGRAMLEARQLFLDACKPHIDPQEQKTMAQFYILGDPSLSPVKSDDASEQMNTIDNRRDNLFKKGVNLGRSVEPARRIKTTRRSPDRREVNQIIRKNGFEGKKELVFETKRSKNHTGTKAKKILFQRVRFRTYMKGKKMSDGFPRIEALVIKENSERVLGWKRYTSR